MTQSKIEWTQETWNPIVGCSIVSPGCTNCYAMKQGARIQKMNPTGGSNSNYVNHYDGTTTRVNGNVVWTGKIAIAPDRIFLEPLRRKKPTTWFVNSMGDLFHEDVPDEAIDRVFAVIALTPHHTYQVLTKRAERMREYCANARIRAPGFVEIACGLACKIPEITDKRSIEIAYTVGVPYPLPNVWPGVSAEDQQRADERRGPLKALADAGWTTFVSYEPALGPVDWTGWEFLRWLISGGESGSHARPSNADWHRGARDWCAAHGVAFFFKQWGEWREPQGEEEYDTSKGRAGKPPAFIISADGSVHCFQHLGDDNRPVVIRVGKKTAGRLLDGKEHNEMPTLAT